MVVAEDALRREYRVRLLNRKWIEGMMKEGYAGADQMTVMVSNSMGWEIMRPGSVGDDIWNDIAAVYVHDKYGLSVKQWMETANPLAYQDLTEVMLESIRKGYWNADAALTREIAEQYAGPLCGTVKGAGCAAAATRAWNSSSKKRSRGRQPRSGAIGPGVSKTHRRVGRGAGRGTGFRVGSGASRCGHGFTALSARCGGSVRPGSRAGCTGEARTGCRRGQCPAAARGGRPWAGREPAGQRLSGHRQRSQPQPPAWLWLALGTSVVAGLILLGLSRRTRRPRNKPAAAGHRPSFISGIPP